jgi:hypothetical protein
MLRIATWNINSVRLRADQVSRFVAESGTDVLCLQEIKCLEDQFPRAAFEAMGLPHLKIGGQKGWHGVAIASRKPITEAPPAGRLPRGARPLRRRHGRRRRDPEFLHSRGRGRPRPGREPEVRPQAGLLRAADRRDGRRATGSARWCWPGTSTSRQARTTSGTTATCRRWSATRRSRSRPCGGCRPPATSADVVRDQIPEPQKAGQLVELPRRRLPQVEPRPAAGPPVDLAGADRRR